MWGRWGLFLSIFGEMFLPCLQVFFALLRGKVTQGGKLFILLCIGTVPAIIVGFILATYEIVPRSVSVIGWTMIVYAVVLYVVDRIAADDNKMSQLSGAKAFWVGCAQALALIPGTSRSGACMTMMRFLGFNRCEAARFSFLLAIPSIAAAASLTTYQMVKQGQFSSIYKDASIAVLISFVAGIIAINFMLKWLRKADFTPFVIYRFALGGFLLYWAYYL